MDDPALRRHLASGARAALARFNVDTMVEATERVYGELCGSPLGAHPREGEDRAWRNTAA